MKHKTHKAAARRIRISGTGKAIQRHTGQDHFNARDTGKMGQRKRMDREIAKVYRGAIAKLLPNDSISK